MLNALPKWFEKARTIAARVASPVGQPFYAAKREKSFDLYLYDEIGVNPWTGGGIDPRDVLKALDEAKDATELVVHVNSPGGNVFDGIAIYNAIRAFGGKSTVQVDGIAASIASIIAISGDRTVTNEGAMWMVHDPAGGMMSFGTADELEEDSRKLVAALRKVRENLLDVYINATGQPLADVSAWMTNETWMTAAEALARGFTDEVAKRDPPEEEKPAPRKAAASADLDTLRFAAMARERKLSQYRNAASRVPASASREKK
jgi:ATP-dependent protease ClpP protease subunit